MRMVQALQSKKEIVGMTGDGVNDAPALKQADVGVAMGIKGTEVTKEAADMVLTDDNFATIASAVREGRRVYDNLKKTILFVMPTNLAQGLLIVIALLAGNVLPLTPVLILWMNMTTSATLSFGLAFEAGEKNIMRRPPRDPKIHVMDGFAIWRVAFVGSMIAVSAFILEAWLQPRAQNPTGASFSPQRIDALADVLLAHYPNGVGMPLIVEDDHSGDVANAYATSLAQRLPQHVVHIRSFSKSHGPDLRLAALSGPEDAVEAIIAQRRLGSGWVSRFLQEILYEMLADKEAFHTVTNARHIYATRQKTMHALLLRQSLDVHTGDGLNLWIPVRDEPAALRLLAERGIRVAAGKPFLPSLRISADVTGADAGAGAGVDAHASRGIRVQMVGRLVKDQRVRVGEQDAGQFDTKIGRAHV